MPSTQTATMVPRTASPLIVQPVAYIPPSRSGLSTIESCQLVITRPPRTLPLVGMSRNEAKGSTEERADHAGRSRRGLRRWPDGWGANRLEADALGGKGLRDRFLHLVEDAGPGDRNHDGRDDCQKKGFHGFLPLSYSAGAAAAELALPWASRAFCCSSQRL